MNFEGSIDSFKRYFIPLYGKKPLALALHLTLGEFFTIFNDLADQ